MFRGSVEGFAGLECGIKEKGFDMAGVSDAISD